jgi:hypothetical protein
MGYRKKVVMDLTMECTGKVEKQCKIEKIGLVTETDCRSSTRNKCQDIAFVLYFEVQKKGH